jgi:hypothetical protein
MGMIKIEKPTSWDMCGICLEPAKIRLNLIDYNGNSSTQKLCTKCELALSKTLNEHIRFNGYLNKIKEKG